ncbi:hypothetical protein AQUCO_00300179v1 [Aquilegia coerulea]|uniref:PRA1 family protein n=1 Tax=Aquilegia coerulea TaxID=218851 RepID=A0A2G5EXK4_AQUCA|nr:hypothetical protein AQUCO_00300179v1 [Aquilegia coerulea]
MDWGNVTAEDLVNALREVDWSTSPRPLAEFFSRFSLPRSFSRWNSRLKCNLYYFAVTFNERVTRTVRQFSPHLAAKMRPPITPVIRGGRPSSKRAIHICGKPRWMFVFFFLAGGCFLWFTSCSLLTVLLVFAGGLLATILHASFRTPNLKARLNTYREEFRAVWRNYSDL